MGENMKNTYKKYLLTIISSLLMVFTLTSCFANSNNNHNKGNGSLPITMNVGKYTVTILDNVYVNSVYTTTYIVESTDDDLDHFLLFPRSLNDVSTNGVYTLIKDIDANKRYIILSTIISSKDVPNDLYLEFQAYDKSDNKKQTVVSDTFTFQKNVVSDFENVQAREMDKIIQTPYGEMLFLKVLYTEEKVSLFIRSIGSNSLPRSSIENSESDNYYFKINDMSENYFFVVKDFLYKNDNPFGSSPQVDGYGEEVSWIETGTIDIPISHLPDNETFTLNICEKSSNQVVDSIDLENIKPNRY